MILRPLVVGDESELLRIHRTPEVARWWDVPDEGFPWTDEPETTRLTIEVQGAVAGLIQFCEELTPRYRHAAIDLFLDPALHGRGLGTEAVRRVVRHLIDDRGHHRVTIDPATANVAAIRAYEKAGFKPVGVMRRYERDIGGEGWHDALLMELLAVELVIFDCDGVLVDSEVISNGVLARALSAEGLDTTLAQARHDYQGLLLAEVVAHAQAKLGRALPAGWLECFERDRAAAFRRELEPVRGAAEAVRRVRAAGLAVCVASQGALEKTRLTLGITGLGELLPEDVRFSASQVERGKPHPDLFLHAARTMGVAPACCVVVEDTPLGVRAGVAAGMRVLGYAADSDPEALRGAGAGTLLWSLDELPGLLGVEGQAPISARPDTDTAAARQTPGSPRR